MNEDLDNPENEIEAGAQPETPATPDEVEGEEDLTEEGAETDTTEQPAGAEGEAAGAEGSAPPQKSRAALRIEKLARERDQEREARQQEAIRAARAEAALAERTRINSTGQSEEQKRAEAARLELMEPHERVAYQANKDKQELQNQVNMLALQMQDARDEAAFNAKASIDPRYAAHLESVNRMHAELRSKGVSTSREDILAYQIGKQALAQAAKADTEKRATADKRKAAVAGKPASARSDQGATRGKGKSLEDKLANVQL